MNKKISFNDAYVTCLTCDCCYDQNGDPKFCQAKSHSIDQRAILVNMSVAANCDAWFPKAIGRANCGKDYNSGIRYYEKDSLA